MYTSIFVLPEKVFELTKSKYTLFDHDTICILARSNKFII